MARLGGLDQPELDRAGPPVVWQLKRVAAGCQNALALCIPDLEDGAWALHLSAVLPLAKVDPVTHLASTLSWSEIEIAFAEGREARDLDLKVGNAVAIHIT